MCIRDSCWGIEVSTWTRRVSREYGSYPGRQIAAGQRLAKRTPKGSALVKALVYHGPSNIALEDKPTPVIDSPTDAIVKVTKTTICGTDLHIVKGDVPTVTDGRILGNTVDGVQAEYVRIPFAGNSLYPILAGADEEALVMLSDILPTGFECGVLNGQVKPGDTVAIVGGGPVGLAALLTAQFYSPAEIIMVDVDDNRLEVAKKFGATKVINNSDGKAVEKVMALTDNRGVDVAIEAIGISVSFDVCQEIVAAGGHIANIGVHGKPVQLNLDKLWSHNITLTTRLVDTVTTPMLLKTVMASKLQPEQLITHHFALDDVMGAYDTFGNAMKERALKVIITND